MSDAHSLMDAANVSAPSASTGLAVNNISNIFVSHRDTSIAKVSCYVAANHGGFCLIGLL